MSPAPTADRTSRQFQRPLAARLWVAGFFAANLGALVLLALQHYTAALIVFFLPAPWYAFQVLNPSARGLGPATTHFSTPRREVWLTIDDGPNPATTPAFLDLLDAHGARATFFLIGKKVIAHPELVALILRRGHTVGNHTHTHPCWHFWHASARRTATEIDACSEALVGAGAGEIRWFRSPVGLKNYALHPLLARRELDLVLWSARGFDGINRAHTAVLARITARLKPGAIILVHENDVHAQRSVELIRALLERLEQDGYTCVIPPPENLVRVS